MKYIITALLLFCFGCSDDPPSIPIAPTTWIDAATHGDTIITDAEAVPGLLYYAIKNWQSYPDSNFTNGFRRLVIRQGDSVLIALSNPAITKYYGPYLVVGNAENDSLYAQNFLDSINNKTVSRVYVLLK